MRPALSVRIAESPRDKSAMAVPLERILDLAADAGFEGISLRASAVAIDSGLETRRQVRSELTTRNLACSMVTGDLPLAINNERATDAIRHIDPYLDLAETMGARLVRVMLHESEDIAHARRACDAARERGITLAQQCHWGSLAETTAAARELVRLVDRPNFGITYEPANLLAAGGPHAQDAIEALAPVTVNVYYQNIMLNPQSPLTFDTRTRGPVGVDFLPLNDERGIAFAPLLGALERSGYSGWVTVHQPLLPGQSLASVVAAAGRLFHAGGSPAVSAEH